MLHVVLFEPDIPWNTGNVGRTCLATGATLHLVGRLGFSIDESRVKRAGLDYWHRVQVKRHADWEQFLASVPKGAALFFFSKKSCQSFWEVRYPEESYLIFGCETRGLPDRILERYQERVYTIPMQPSSVRSLNLSTAVGIVVFEVLRQQTLSQAKIGKH